MTHFIELGEKERPVCFTQALGYEYERTMQRSFLRDLNGLFEQIARVGQAIGTNDVGEAAAGMSVVILVDMAYCALRLGYRREKMEVDFDAYDVADWILNNEPAVSQLTVWLVEANIDTSKKPEPQGSKKKPTIPLKRTPKG